MNSEKDHNAEGPVQRQIDPRLLDPPKETKRLHGDATVAAKLSKLSEVRSSREPSEARTPAPPVLIMSGGAHEARAYLPPVSPHVQPSPSTFNSHRVQIAEVADPRNAVTERLQRPWPPAGGGYDSAAFDMTHGSMSIANVVPEAPEPRGKRRMSALLGALVACLLLTGTGVGFLRTRSAGPVALARGGGLAGQELSQVLRSTAHAGAGSTNAAVEFAQPAPQAADDDGLDFEVYAPPPKSAAPVLPQPNRASFRPVRKATPQESMPPPAVNIPSPRELVE